MFFIDLKLDLLSYFYWIMKVFFLFLLCILDIIDLYRNGFGVY